MIESLSLPLPVTNRQFFFFSAEIRYIHSARRKQALYFGTLPFCLTKIIMCATVATYVLNGHLMNASAIFVAYGLFSCMRISKFQGMPYAIQMTSEALISLRRVQVFSHFYYFLFSKKLASTHLIFQTLIPVGH